MINLIPNEEKKKMSKDFYFRLITVFFAMLGISLLVASIAILPSYFLSSAEENAINTKLELQNNETIPLPDQNTLMAIKDLKNKLSQIENIQKTLVNVNDFKQVINEIIFKKTSNIKITAIFYKKDPQAGEEIKISGLASSREVLLSFRRALEDDIAFSKIDLPISNFVKGSNIKFSLSLIPS
ncbi:MAG: hypothetical protein NT161_01325 [Candidatus Nomurabacteria bacterium]|nr:hypothetical protein [Candidatus Nomurabacteria bacterium]